MDVMGGVVDTDIRSKSSWTQNCMDNLSPQQPTKTLGCLRPSHCCQGVVTLKWDIFRPVNSTGGRLDEVLISETERHLMNYDSFPSQVSIAAQNSCEKGSCKHLPSSLAQGRHRNIETITGMLWLANVANHSHIFPPGMDSSEIAIKTLFYSLSEG